MKKVIVGFMFIVCVVLVGGCSKSHPIDLSLVDVELQGEVVGYFNVTTDRIADMGSGEYALYVSVENTSPDYYVVEDFRYDLRIYSEGECHVNQRNEKGYTTKLEVGEIGQGFIPFEYAPHLPAPDKIVLAIRVAD